MNHYSSSGDCVSQIENKDFITFKDYVCEVTGLTNYTLAYLSFYSMTNVGAACILYDVLRYVRRKTKDDNSSIAAWQTNFNGGGITQYHTQFMN